MRAFVVLKLSLKFICQEESDNPLNLVCTRVEILFLFLVYFLVSLFFLKKRNQDTEH